jgi:hypothetical protein
MYLPEPEDRCFQCGKWILPRYGYVPMCALCNLAHVVEISQRDAWKRRLTAMGAAPGRRTKRAARMRAIAGRAVPANDNAACWSWGKPRVGPLRGW